MFDTIISGTLVGPRVPTLSTMGVLDQGAAKEDGIVADADALENALRAQLAGKLRDDVAIRFGDGSYYLPTVSEVQGILAASASDRRTWLKDRFDCDDFAYVLKGEMSVHAYDTSSMRFGLCVGIVWGNFDWVDGYHAVNWFMSNDGKLRFTEPMDDLIYEASSCKGDLWLLLA